MVLKNRVETCLGSAGVSKAFKQLPEDIDDEDDTELFEAKEALARSRVSSSFGDETP